MDENHVRALATLRQRAAFAGGILPEEVIAYYDSLIYDGNDHLINLLSENGITAIRFGKVTSILRGRDGNIISLAQPLLKNGMALAEYYLGILNAIYVHQLRRHRFEISPKQYIAEISLFAERLNRMALQVFSVIAPEATLRLHHRLSYVQDLIAAFAFRYTAKLPMNLNLDHGANFLNGEASNSFVKTGWHFALSRGVVAAFLIPLSISIMQLPTQVENLWLIGKNAAELSTALSDLSGEGASIDLAKELRQSVDRDRIELKKLIEDSKSATAHERVSIEEKILRVNARIARRSKT